MKKFYVVLALILGLNNYQLYGQDTAKYQSKWYFKPMLGGAAPISKLLNGQPTDNLVKFGDKSFHLQFLAGTYFFKPRWGIDFCFQLISSGSIEDRYSNFYQLLTEKYGEKYYVNFNESILYWDNSIILGQFHRGMLGLVHRYEANKWLVQPRVMLGTTVFDTNQIRVNLKQKNSNNYMILEYDPKITFENALTVSPSVSVGYKINQNTYLNLDLGYSAFRGKFGFNATTTDLYTRNISQETFLYNQLAQSMNAGVGLIYVLR